MKRLSILCVTVLLALAVMGFGFAKWSDSVSIAHSVDSGKVSWGFYGVVSDLENGLDWNSNPGFTDKDQLWNDAKDVARTTWEYSDTDGNGIDDLLTVTVENAYPRYYNKINTNVKNYGSIPVVIQKARLHWGGEEYVIDNGFAYQLYDDGSIARYDANNPEPEGAVMEFRWLDNEGEQQHPEQVFDTSYEFAVLQPAAQDTDYIFSISVEAVQWNQGIPVQ